GSAADSAVAYCLGITEVDSIARGLLFERFMSIERAQKPDIDIDFDARHRDDVAGYAYEKYGADKVASVCTYNTYQARSAVRDVGKALGFSEEDTDRIAKRLPYIHADEIRRAMSRLPELRDLGLDPAKFDCMMEVCEKIAGFPRFLGTHLGGIVISRRPITDLTPLQMAAKGVVVAQFDKDDVEELGLIKLDLLSLRMLSAVGNSLDMINGGSAGSGGGGVPRRGDVGGGRPPLEYEGIPVDDEESYRMIREGRTVGVFQLESPAQRALQGRLGADRFEDLVASVALIRPGPILGNMVEPYIARRTGLEPVRYIDSRLKPILGKTYGVVLFQEQVIQIATAVAGFTPGESDRLRRVMTHSRSKREMDEIGEVFIEKAMGNGTPRHVAEKVFSYIVGYAGYGFCEAHAAAFATTAAKTAYLARHHPAEFFAAILSNQPMGYYPPETIAVEARRRGVRILGPCVNRSGKGFTVEDGDGSGTGVPTATGGSVRAIRVSLGCVRDMTGQALDRIVEARRERPFTSLEDFCRRVRAPRNVVENLVLCGAFDSIEPNRRSLLWKVSGALAAAHPLLEGREGRGDTPARGETPAPCASIPDFSVAEKIAYEYRVLGIAVSGHPMAILRERLNAEGILSSADVSSGKAGTLVRVAGLPIRPHRPPTRSGRIVVFVSLEDEFGLVDVTIFENVYQECGQVIFTDPAPPLIVAGRLERRGAGMSVTARRVEPLRMALQAGDPRLYSDSMLDP
ncbi:MAG: DNA polymerase III subunit alpha, partial [Firmicutes bacterium]|nr:DNA polymerase III subunit alpha [Bacillota bacterium]